MKIPIRIKYIFIPLGITVAINCDWANVTKACGEENGHLSSGPSYSSKQPEAGWQQPAQQWPHRPCKSLEELSCPCWGRHRARPCGAVGKAASLTFLPLSPAGSACSQSRRWASNQSVSLTPAAPCLLGSCCLSNYTLKRFSASLSERKAYSSDVVF